MPASEGPRSGALFEPDRVRPAWVGVAPAREVVPGIAGVIGHAGPPLEWWRLGAHQRQALVDLLRFENRLSAPDFVRLVDQGPELAAPAIEAVVREHAGEPGGVALRSNWELGVVAPLIGLVSESMPVLVVEDAYTGFRAIVPVNEGTGPSLRFGHLSQAVVDRQIWLAEVFVPVVSRALERAGPIDLLPLMGQALWMGDELHMRSRAASMLLAGRLCRALDAFGPDSAGTAAVREFVWDNPLFFLNLAMAAARIFLAGWANAGPHGAVVACAANGRDIGIQIAGQPGIWHLAPAPVPGGQAPGASVSAAIGDSLILEVFGLGGRIIRGAPGLWDQMGIDEPRLLMDSEESYYGCRVSVLSTLTAPCASRGLAIGWDARAMRHGRAPIRFNTAQVGIYGGMVGMGRFDLPQVFAPAVGDAAPGLGPDGEAP